MTTEALASPRPADTSPEDAGGRVETVTFGCRLNAAESDAIARLAGAAGGAEDLVVVNTCAVTGEAARQARQAVRRLRRERPRSRIVVTGCAVQIDPASFASMPEVDVALGNAEKMRAETWAELARASHRDDGDRVRVSDIMALRETAVPPSGAPATAQPRARANLEVQNGCDHRCTFCVIPYGRGNSRSTPAGVVVDEARRLVDAGHREIVLTGVDITSWGHDLPGSPKLGALVRRILRHVPDLPRLRLSSLDAIEIDPELYDFVAHEPRVAPHLHLSLQAGDDMILKRMARRHRRADAVALCARLRAARPDIAFGADLIAGFPTETDAMFANSLALVNACGLAYVHVFPFSPRPGTPAARMPQLPRAVIKERAGRLRAAGAAALSRHLNGHVGGVRDVLIERAGPDGLMGRLADFTEARLIGTEAIPGDCVSMRVTGHDGRALTGKAQGALT